MAVDEFAITTLADLKSWLGITSSDDDAVLETAIDAATYAIEAYCDRKIVQRRIYEWVSPRGDGALVVRHPPVAHVHYIGSGAQAAMTVSSTVASDISVTVTITDDSFCIVRTESDGTETTVHSNFNQRKTVAELAPVLNTLGWVSATVTTNTLTRRLHKIVGRDLTNAPVVLTFPDQGQFDVTGDLPRGILYIGRSGYDDGYGGRWPRAPESVFVDYDGGFETVPPDIVTACHMMAARMYRGRRRDPGVTTESFGDYSYSLATGDAMDAEARALLGPWKRYR